MIISAWCINTNDFSTKAGDGVKGVSTGCRDDLVNRCLFSSSRNMHAAYSNTKLALVNQCNVLSFHSK